MRVYRRWVLVFLLAAGEAAAEPLRLGTTFSPRQCRYLQVDASQTLQAILKHPFDLVRFAAYWDDLEPEEGIFDFSSLDGQIAQARARQVPVVLCVGMKAPRWPEYFIPAWALRHLRLRKGGDVSRHAYLRERTLRYIEAVVTRYRDEAIIRYWQVENEPLDRTGVGFWWISPAFLKQEVALVRRLDPAHRPILLTTVTYPDPALRWFMSLFIRHDTIEESLRLGDILGVNVYPVVGHRWFFKKSYTWTTPEQRRTYLTSILKRAQRHQKAVWVTELQAEPWEPDHLVYTEPSPPPTADPARLPADIEELRALGMQAVLLWGAEYWEFRKTQYQDAGWWHEISRLLYKPPILAPPLVRGPEAPGWKFKASPLSFE